MRSTAGAFAISEIVLAPAKAGSHERRLMAGTVGRVLLRRLPCAGSYDRSHPPNLKSWRSRADPEETSAALT